MLEIKDDEHFDEIFEAKKSENLIFAYFTAKWCGPCKAIAPFIQDQSQKYAGKCEFLKIDIDDNEEVADRYNVSSIPAFLIFKNGEVVDRVSGANEDEVSAILDKNL